MPLTFWFLEFTQIKRRAGNAEINLAVKSDHRVTS
jgi:hypothetical protein